MCFISKHPRNLSAPWSRELQASSSAMRAKQLESLVDDKEAPLVSLVRRGRRSRGSWRTDIAPPDRWVECQVPSALGTVGTELKFAAFWWCVPKAKGISFRLTTFRTLRQFVGSVGKTRAWRVKRPEGFCSDSRVPNLGSAWSASLPRMSSDVFASPKSG